MKKKEVKKNDKPSRFISACMFFYSHVRLGLTLWISIVLFGFFAYTTWMQREGFPQVGVPISVVQGIYFANDKNIVDEQLTQPLLSVIDSQDNVKSTRATTTPIGTVIVVTYNDGVTSGDGSNATKSAVESASLQLPSTAKVSYESVDASRFNNKYDILLSVSSPTASLDSLLATADSSAQMLQENLSEVEAAEVISPFTESIDPATGQPIERQTQYDWFAESHDGALDITQSVAIGIKLQEGTDIVVFDEALHKQIDEIQSSLEQNDITLHVAAGFADGIREQTSSLQKNLYEGLLIVILISFIFIGLRTGFLAALAMTATLMLTLGILYVTGVTLNTITLFGLVLCLGLIVDDIVIMLEAIDTQRKKKKSLHESIVIAIKKVALASTAGTLTTVLGFMPLLFFGGILGDFIRILPITIIISLLVSLFVSLTFVPLISRVFSTRSWDKEPRKSPLDFIRKGITAIGDISSNVIMSGNTRKKKFLYALGAVLISLSFLVAAGSLFSKLPFDIFPTTKDSNQLQIEIAFAPTVTIEQAKEITKQANEIISERAGSDIDSITYLGSANERQAQVSITLVPYQKRENTSPQIAATLDEALSVIPNARIAVNQVSAGPPKEELPFKVQITATNPAAANLAAENLVTFLQNKEVQRPNGTTAKITAVQYNGEQATITRTNGTRIVEVSAGFDATDTSALVSATQELVEQQFVTNTDLTNGLTSNDFAFDFGFESQNQESFKTVVYSLPILLIAMFILLAIQFRSFLQPLLILIAVPFSFFGVALGLNLTDNPLSFFVMIGFFALIGISVNNTILLTDFANQGRKQGLAPREAMAQAVRERIRPLITTSTTTVMALIPLVLSDPFWESLAITLIGGLLSSTLLVILVFPYFYLILEYFRTHSKAWFGKKLRRT